MSEKQKRDYWTVPKPSLQGCRRYIAAHAIALIVWFALMFWLCGFGSALLWQ